MKSGSDQRIVMTLDAGGTNFVFSAVKANEEIVPQLTMPSHAHDLTQCLATIVKGFSEIKSKLPYEPVAISFAFPGPADYPKGIIGDLGNLPAFRGGVALGPMLEERFKMPVFINNDGDLFAYGESIAGFLPYVNGLLETAGSPKRYENLVGLTLGTGFGGGIVSKGELFLGDNSSAGEVWLLRNKLDPAMNAEEGASIRAVQKTYARATGVSVEQAPSPKDIYEIGMGTQKGNKSAAIAAYHGMGEVVGDALANTLTLIDGLAVIGGGVAGAHSLFLTALVGEMNAPYVFPDGQKRPRLVSKVYNLEDERERLEFLRGGKTTIRIPQSERTIVYDPIRRTGVGITRLGTSKAVSVGAYAFALNALDAHTGTHAR
ncbi:MAG TPA: ROK family protein [Bacteroidota bacterium]